MFTTCRRQLSPPCISNPSNRPLEGSLERILSERGVSVHVWEVAALLESEGVYGSRKRAAVVDDLHTKIGQGVPEKTKHAGVAPNTDQKVINFDSKQPQNCYRCRSGPSRGPKRVPLGQTTCVG